MNSSQIGPSIRSRDTSCDRRDREVLLRVDRLVKSYSDLVAVRDVSFRVLSGETFVIVGPNGSGKTSTVECIEGIREPDSGDISLMGLSPNVGPCTYNKLFGAQLQESSLPARIRLREALQLFAQCYRDPWEVGDLLDRIGFEPAQHRQFFDTLSGGQKRRLMLALALLGRPSLIILDEPTSGLDPHARLAMWNLLDQAIADGTTILMTTHDLVEAQEHGTTVALFDEGKIRALGTPQGLIEAQSYHSKIRIQYGEKVHRIVKDTSGCRMTRQIEGSLYGFGDVDFALSAAAKLRREAPATAAQMITGPVSLEDVYMILTTNDNHGDYINKKSQEASQ